MSNKSESPAKKIPKTREESSISDEEFEEPPAFSLATLGLQRVGTLPPPKPQTQQPIQTLNARGMPARIRKRNRLFFDDELINDDKPLRMSLSPRKAIASSSTTSATTSSMKGLPAVVLPIKSPNKGIKKRKGVAARFIAPTARASLPPPQPRSIVPIMQGKLKSAKEKSQREVPTVTKRPFIYSATKSGSKIVATSTLPTTTTTVKCEPADKKLGQSIGMRLRNLLKLPKAHKWVIFEWFYSFVDKPLFEGHNEFQTCLTESFPNLRTDGLTRREWQNIRTLIGRPRRCSTSFFEEERRDLERKRQRIRYIQTRKSGDVRDINFVRDLPDKIPLPLPVGTLVTARLRLPQDGIFSGTVDAFDSLTSTYRVTFDRNGLGTHSIPDIEIYSENFHETLPLQSFTKDYRPNLASLFHNTQPKMLLSNSAVAVKVEGATNASGVAGAGLDNVRSALNMHINRSDPLLGQHTMVHGKNVVNGYSAKLLETMVRLQHAMSFKQVKLQRLGNMNDEAELLLVASAHKAKTCNSDSEDSQTQTMPEITEEFQRRYASIIISLEKMNRDMQNYLNDVHMQANTLSRDSQVQAMLAPSYLREKCREDAGVIVKRNIQNQLKDKSVVGLIKNLATVLLVASHLNNDESSAQVSKVLEGCIEEVKSNLSEGNVETFQKNVQIHLHHIRLGIGQNLQSNVSATNTEKESEEPENYITEPEVQITTLNSDSPPNMIVDEDNVEPNAAISPVF